MVLRAKVPVDLAGSLGRREIWRSLDTGDHAVAVKLYRRARADLDTWFDQQRSRRDAGERLNGEAPRLVTEWFHQHERRAADLDFGLVGEVLHDALGETEQELAELLAGDAGADVEAAVNAVLLANGWPSRPQPSEASRPSGPGLPTRRMITGRPGRIRPPGVDRGGAPAPGSASGPAGHAGRSTVLRRHRATGCKTGRGRRGHAGRADRAVQGRQDGPSEPWQGHRVPRPIPAPT